MGVNVAASIEYEFVARPAGLQVEFAAPPDANFQFLAIKAIDGFRVDAALAQPISKLPVNSTLVVSVHGSGRSYDKHPNACLLHLLPNKGLAVLAINTRQAGARVNTENFLDVRRISKRRSTQPALSATKRSCYTATAWAISMCSITPPTIGTRISKP